MSLLEQRNRKERAVVEILKVFCISLVNISQGDLPYLINREKMTTPVV